MTALAAGRITASKGDLCPYAYPVAADAVGFAGGMACLDADGFLVAAADATGYSDVVGIIAADFDNTGGADGAFSAKVYRGIHELVNSGLAEIDVDSNAAVADDQTCQLGSASTYKRRVGRIVKYVSATSVWVDVGHPRAPMFTLSGEITGNGGAQNTAHNLGVKPWGAVAILSNLDGNAAAVTVGAHTATNAVFTVTTGDKYYVQAWA